MSQIPWDVKEWNPSGDLLRLAVRALTLLLIAVVAFDGLCLIVEAL